MSRRVTFKKQRELPHLSSLHNIDSSHIAGGAANDMEFRLQTVSPLTTDQGIVIKGAILRLLTGSQ